MKKTLFAVAALALCGTAVADEVSTSSLNDGGNFSRYYYSNVVFNVDKPVTLNSFSLTYITDTTLNFVGENTFSATGVFEYRSSTTSIMGDTTAATHWESELLNATDTPATITLASAPNTTGSFSFLYSSVTFMGASAGEKVTLGNTELTYMGAFGSINDAMSNIGENQVAFAREYSGANKGFYLVGKATPATPEPATATLSLLALAGMASRRRRK